jgi:hypothetical protein
MQKSALISPTSGCLSADIVRSRTQTVEFVCLYDIIRNKLLIYKAILKPISTHGLKFQHQNFRAFSIQSLAANSECPLVRAKFRHPHTMFASVYTPMNLSPHSPSSQSTSACVDTGPTTCLPDSSNLQYL